MKALDEECLCGQDSSGVITDHGVESRELLPNRQPDLDHVDFRQKSGLGAGVLLHELAKPVRSASPLVGRHAAIEEQELSFGSRRILT